MLFQFSLDFFYSVLRPFQDYFSSCETGRSGGGKPREKRSSVSAGLEPTPDTTVR